MTRFVEVLTGKLAERWMTMLVIPGLIYLVVAAVTARLGQGHWWELRLLRDEAGSIVDDPALRGPGAGVLALALLLAGAAAAGIVVQALGAALTRFWMMRPRDPVTRRLAARRLSAWRRADEAFREALVAAGRAQLSDAPDAPARRQAAERLGAARNRIALAPPQRPFWLGDRMAAADYRVFDKYRLDLTFAWPRLWLVMPDTIRTEFGAARASLTRAAGLAGWAVGYLVLGAWWWPALLIGMVCGVTAWVRARAACDVLADLLESAVDLYGRALAELLGIACPGPLSRETGELVTAALRKNA